MSAGGRDIESEICKVIIEIARRRTPDLVEVVASQRLMEELGFDSLDFAQLVATLEIELGVDPFVAAVAVTSINTVGDVIDVYRAALDSAA